MDAEASEKKKKTQPHYGEEDRIRLGLKEQANNHDEDIVR